MTGKIFLRPHKYEIISGDKYKVGDGQIQSQGARGKSVTVTGTNLISKGLASCCHGEGVDCAAMLLVSTAAEEKLLIPVRMGMVPVRIMKRRMIQVRM